MNSFFNLVLKYLCLFVRYGNELCRPNEKYTKDKVQTNFIYKRNQVLLIFHVVIFLFCGIDVVFGKGFVTANVQGTLTAVFVIGVFILSKHYHPEIFNLSYNLILFAYGPHMAMESTDGVISSWLGVQTFPIFIYLFTTSLWHFLLHATLQAICLNTFYQNIMIDSLHDMPPHVFTSVLTKSSNLTVIINLTFVFLTHKFIQSARYHATAAEKQEKECEKQRIFILGFSHELRNLLNSLLGNLELANLEHLPSKAKGLLRSAEICSDLLLYLVNNILDSGKIEVNDLEVNETPGGIYNTVEKIWRTCAELIDPKSIHGRLRIENNIPAGLSLDHNRLKQIFFNLVDNALKSTEKGMIDISVEWLSNRERVDDKCFEPLPFNEEDDQDEGVFEKTQKLAMLNGNMMLLNCSRSTIDRTSIKEKNEVTQGVLKIVVSDTGYGISKQNLNRTFMKSDQTIIEGGSVPRLGTGLGLFVTKELCQKMGGEIKVFTKEGKGSSFIVCLPAKPVTGITIALHKTESIMNLLANKKLRAMIVDDIQFNHTLLDGFFNKLGIEVVERAFNGEEAHQRFAKHLTNENQNLNIVTMDLDMPVMNGKLASQKIREFEFRNRMDPCLLIIISGNSSKSEIDECLDKNGKIKADAFLKKPVAIDELGHLIARHFSSLRQRHVARFNSI